MSKELFHSCWFCLCRVCTRSRTASLLTNSSILNSAFLDMVVETFPTTDGFLANRYVYQKAVLLSLSSRILQDQFASPCPCPQTTSPCPWTTKFSKTVKSINSVTATVRENTVKNGLLTDVKYCSLIHVSKYTVHHCNPGCWSQRKSMSMRTNLQVHVLVLVHVLGAQVFVLVLVVEDQFTSPCPCP